jgi:hypothetical protein
LCGLSFSGKTTLARKIVERRRFFDLPHPPDGPITVGIDGGYVRAAHKQGWFEVIAGKSVVAFWREDEGEVPSAKCFGFVQTYDEKPRRRLWELMKSQGMQVLVQT